MKENNKQKTTLFKKTSSVLLLIIGAIMITSVIGSVFTTFRNENILKVDIKAWEITDDGVKVLGSWSLIKTIIILALGIGAVAAGSVLWSSWKRVFGLILITYGLLIEFLTYFLYPYWDQRHYTIFSYLSLSVYPSIIGIIIIVLGISLTIKFKRKTL